MFLSYYHHSWGFKSHQCGCGIGKVYKLSRSGFVRTLQHPPPAYGKQPIGPACWLGLIFQWEDTREQEKVPQLQSEYLIILIGTSEYLGLLQVFLSIWIKKPHWPNGNKAFVKTLPSLIVSTSRPTNIYIYIFFRLWQGTLISSEDLLKNHRHAVDLSWIGPFQGIKSLFLTWFFTKEVTPWLSNQVHHPVLGSKLPLFTIFFWGIVINPIA